jgi:predicted glycosyltransferase
VTPTVLFHCQHSLGLGHLARSLALAGGIARYADVVLLSGGRLPAGTRVPPGVRLVGLPPLGHGPDYQLVSHDPLLGVGQAQDRRRHIVLETFEVTDPDAVVVEMFPFGRKKFAGELMPLLEAVSARGLRRPRTVCSVRDILVRRRPDQAAHDERAALVANRHFDAVLVHSDPGFARLEESFTPATPLTVPVHHTGFVVPENPGPPAPAGRLPRLIVSSGGGMVGEPLVRAAVLAHRPFAERTGLHTTVVAGPFLPGPAWEWLQEQADRSPMLDAVRQVDDLRAEIGRSALSLSQCGYNTTMDLLRAGTPAVVVPYAEGREDEQVRRARRLAELGAVRSLHPDDLTPDRLVAELCALRTFRAEPTGLDLTGRETSARLVAELIDSRSGILAGVAR